MENHFYNKGLIDLFENFQFYRIKTEEIENFVRAAYKVFCEENNYVPATLVFDDHVEENEFHGAQLGKTITINSKDLDWMIRMKDCRYRYGFFNILAHEHRHFLQNNSDCGDTRLLYASVCGKIYDLYGKFIFGLIDALNRYQEEKGIHTDVSFKASEKYLTNFKKMYNTNFPWEHDAQYYSELQMKKVSQKLPFFEDVYRDVVERNQKLRNDCKEFSMIDFFETIEKFYMDNHRFIRNSREIMKEYIENKKIILEIYEKAGVKTKADEKIFDKKLYPFPNLNHNLNI